MNEPIMEKKQANICSFYNTPLGQRKPIVGYTYISEKSINHQSAQQMNFEILDCFSNETRRHTHI